MWVFPQVDGVLFQVPDSHLVQRALEEDERAFEELIHRYLFQRIVFRLGDYDTSCDVFQQVLVQLYLALPMPCRVIWSCSVF